MGVGRLLTLLAAGLLSIATAAPAFAAPVGAATPATGRAQLLYPVQVRRLQDLNFGYLGVTTAGTAVINPDTDALTTTGGVVSLGGFPYAALFEAVSPRKGVVLVRIPRNPITLTRAGGMETMTVSNWTISGGGNSRNVAAQEAFSFAIGGTLFVNANQVEGTYNGTFDVEVQYP